MRIFLSLCMIFLFALNVRGQLNDYKYIIVPKKFADFKKENQHLTSTLVKHLFAEKGFTTVYDDAIPDELLINKCLGLKVGLDDESSIFTTKVKLILEDCHGKSVYVTQEGRSKEKEYKISYNEAITQAFDSIEALEYAYTGKPEEETVTLNFKNDVKSLEGEPSVEKQPRKKNQNPAIEQEATPENQSFKSREPVESNYKKGVLKAPDTAVSEKVNSALVLYAQELPNGYQLVDSSPKIVMTLFKTSMKDIYAAKQGTINGLVFKKGEKWFFDYTQDEKLIQQELNIKF